MRRFASTHEILANRDIPFQRVRVVDDSGLVGDFNLQEALILAKQRRTDLVVLSGQVDPPLCRLVNLHVYVDELEKQAASKEQKQREQKLREFSFDPAMRVKGWVWQNVLYCVVNLRKKKPGPYMEHIYGTSWNPTCDPQGVFDWKL